MKKDSTHIIHILAVPFIRFFDFFECKKGDRPYLFRLMSMFFVAASLLLATAFVSRAFDHAAKKEMWLDEYYTLAATIQKAGVAQIILHGAPEQASSPPLDYIFMRVYDVIRPQVKSFGLPFNVYYRLHSISVNLISGLFVVFLLFRKIKENVSNHLVFVLQVFLLLSALGFYYFWYFNFQYSIEMRPYALWNSLWLATLAMYVYYGRMNSKIVFVLCLLSATANGSVFQMAVLMSSIVLVGLVDREDMTRKAKEMAKAFALPAVIFLYYAAGQADYGSCTPAETQEYYRNFYHFWLTKEKIPILSVMGILMTMPFKSLRPLLTIFVCTLGLYLLSPVMNFLIVSKGYFFSSRHYIYYDLIFPLFLIHLAIALPVYHAQLKRSV